MRWLYSGFFYLAAPAIAVRLLWKSRRLPDYRHRWLERWAFYGESSAQRGGVWFHAVSVGEAEAAFPLIAAWRSQHPEQPILVTCTTPTGSARIRAELGATVQHVYLPYDLPDAIARFLDRFAPRLGVILETELWPNLYRLCAQRGVPLALVNGRLSQRSLQGYLRVAPLSRATARCLRLVAAQSEADAIRYMVLGVAKAHCAVVGNLKFDRTPTGARESAAVLRAQLGAGGRPTLIAGSTHAGEEAAVLDAFAKCREHFADALLLLAPRRPERFDEVAHWLKANGWRVARRSRNESAAQADVYLIDTLGDLGGLYAAAQVAFVGGSLIPHGGHNPIEPAAVGIPVLFGPHMTNCAALARALEASGGGRRVTDAVALAAAWSALLDDGEQRHQMGAAAQQFVARNCGAVQRTVEQLQALL